MFRRLFRFIFRAFDSSVFVVEIRKDAVQAVKGKVPAAFLSEVAQLAKESGLKSGVIRGVLQSTYIRITFSEDIPANLHQRFRNVWHIYERSYR